MTKFSFLPMAVAELVCAGLPFCLASSETPALAPGALLLGALPGAMAVALRGARALTDFSETDPGSTFPTSADLA